MHTLLGKGNLYSGKKKNICNCQHTHSNSGNNITLYGLLVSSTELCFCVKGITLAWPTASPKTILKANMSGSFGKLNSVKWILPRAFLLQTELFTPTYILNLVKACNQIWTWGLSPAVVELWEKIEKKVQPLSYHSSCLMLYPLEAADMFIQQDVMHLKGSWLYSENRKPSTHQIYDVSTSKSGKLFKFCYTTYLDWYIRSLPTQQIFQTLTMS